MSLLVVIWLVAVGLMSFALITMAGLIVARILRERARAKHNARRATVLPEIVQHIGGLSVTPLNLHGLEKDAFVMAGIVRDLAGLVRGGERARLMQALVGLKVDRSLRTLLISGSTNQRVMAAEALVFFPGEETRSALLEAARHGAYRVRVAALRSAIDVGAAPPLGELLDSVASGSERASLLFSDLLQRATRTQIDEAVAALSRTDLSRPVRIMVIQALGMTRDPRALQPLMDAARLPDPETRAAALAALSVLGHPDARSVVAPGLTDADWRVRLKSIECVRKLGLSEFTAQVQACANDDIWWVRHRATQTLIALAEQDVVKLKAILIEAAQPPDKIKPRRKRKPKSAKAPPRKAKSAKRGPKTARKRSAKKPAPDKPAGKKAAAKNGRKPAAKVSDAKQTKPRKIAAAGRARR